MGGMDFVRWRRAENKEGVEQVAKRLPDLCPEDVEKQL